MQPELECIINDLPSIILALAAKLLLPFTAVVRTRAPSAAWSRTIVKAETRRDTRILLDRNALSIGGNILKCIFLNSVRAFADEHGEFKIGNDVAPSALGA